MTASDVQVILLLVLALVFAAIALIEGRALGNALALWELYPTCAFPWLRLALFVVLIIAALLFTASALAEYFAARPV